MPQRRLPAPQQVTRQRKLAGWRAAFLRNCGLRPCCFAVRRLWGCAAAGSGAGCGASGERAALGSLAGRWCPEVRWGLGSRDPFSKASPLQPSGPYSYLLFTHFLKAGPPASMLFRSMKSVGRRIEAMRGRCRQLMEESTGFLRSGSFRLTLLALPARARPPTHIGDHRRGFPQCYWLQCTVIKICCIEEREIVAASLEYS